MRPSLALSPPSIYFSPFRSVESPRCDQPIWVTLLSSFSDRPFFKIITPSLFLPLYLSVSTTHDFDLVIRTIYGRTILVEFHPKIGRIEIPLQAVRRGDIAYRIATRIIPSPGRDTVEREVRVESVSWTVYRIMTTRTVSMGSGAKIRIRRIDQASTVYARLLRCFAVAKSLVKRSQVDPSNPRIFLTRLLPFF